MGSLTLERKTEVVADKALAEDSVTASAKEESRPRVSSTYSDTPGASRAWNARAQVD